MSVFKKPKSPYFHYDFQLHGRRYHGSTSCKSKRDATEFEARERRRAALPSQERPSITIDEACGLYQERVERAPSWPTMRYMLASLVKGLGRSKLLHDIGPRELQRFFSARQSGRANSTLNREIENARAVWRHAEKARYNVGEQPDWRSLKYKEGKTPTTELSPAEERALFEALRADVRDAVEFLLKSGWRRNEVLKLRWADVDLPHLQAVTRIKGGDVVKRPITPKLADMIGRQPKVCPYVFTYECKQGRAKRLRGERYPLTVTVLRQCFESARTTSGIPAFRIHDLRHTAATRIVRATGSIAAAQAALKHSNISTTLRYAHVMDEDIRNALIASESRNSPEVVTAEQTKSV